MKTLAKTVTHALAAVSLAGAAVTPALADNREQRTVSVSYADIELSTTKGQKLLDQRIEKAVRNVCRTTSLDAGTRIMSKDATECLAKARADAKRQVAALAINERRGG